MRYAIFIPQIGVERAGLCDALTRDYLAVLDSLRGLFFAKRADNVIVNNREFAWAHYPHIILELP